MHRIFLMFCLLLPLSAVASTSFQPVESIRVAVLSTLGQDADAEVALDPALRMPRCGQPLEARRSGGGTVEVGCPEASGWRLFVPVKIRHTQSVLVLTRGVGAGETLVAEMLAPERRDASRIVGAAPSSPSEVVGQVARRALAAGSVLGAGDLVSPRLVRRGDSVALVSRRDGVEVRVAGRALGDAGANERVNVENLSSRRTVQGTVAANGDVVVRH